MSEFANSHRRHVEFEVGDLVWLKLQPYRQHSMAKPQSVKLARRFYGPFEILQKIGPVAYRLRLPEGSRIHNVFHVSLLREYVAGEEPQPSVELPTEFVGDRPIVSPVCVLDSQSLWHNGEPVKHVLVRWSDGTESPSWEPLAAISKRFSDILLEDKEVSIGGGVDKAVHDQPVSGEAAVSVEATETGNVQEVTQPVGEPKEMATDRGSETEARSLRPRAQIKPPERFQNYVAK